MVKKRIEGCEGVCNQKCYKLIFMDISMPIMDGYEATQKIRELERKYHFPPCIVVALSAHNAESY